MATDPKTDKVPQPGEYSFEVRFGKAAIAQGVAPVPRIVLDHYALLGVKDREMMWVIQLLAYKWSTSNPFPSRRRFRCSASASAQKRTARRLRELGLMFTTRKYRKGRMASLIYDLDSLLYNCVAIYELIEEYAQKQLVRTMVDPELASKWQWEFARTQVVTRVANGYTITLPPDVMTRLKDGEYHDVAPPWNQFAPAPPDEDQMDGAQLLDLLIPHEPAMGLGIQPNSTKDDDESAAIPVAAGGADSPSAAVLDGICAWNGLAQGRKSLPEKKRKSQQRRLAEIIAQWGGGTTEQANLAWEAWTVRIAWPEVVNIYGKDWENKFGPLLISVREGTITEISLRQEAREAGLITSSMQSDETKMAEQRKQRITDERKRMNKLSPFWRATLGDLQLQMTRATFDQHLRRTNAALDNGTVTVYCYNKLTQEWIANRLGDVITRTLARTLGREVSVTYTTGELPTD